MAYFSPILIYVIKKPNICLCGASKSYCPNAALKVFPAARRTFPQRDPYHLNVTELTAKVKNKHPNTAERK